MTSSNQIRWIISRDLREVVEIEKRSFPNPWSAKDFTACLKHNNSIGTVVETTSGSICGYMLYSLHAGYVRLINMAVAPEVRRTGIGSLMLERLKAKLNQEYRNMIVTDVSERSVEAQLLFRSQGFLAAKYMRTAYGVDTAGIRFEFRSESGGEQ